MDDLARIEQWLERLELRAKEWLDVAAAEGMEPEKAAGHALKGISMITRLMELRKQFDPQAAGQNSEERNETQLIIDALTSIQRQRERKEG